MSIVASTTDEFLTTEDVMKILGVTKQTVHNLTSSGQITYYKIGKTLRFLRDDVDEYIKSKRHPRISERNSARKCA